MRYQALAIGAASVGKLNELVPKEKEKMSDEPDRNGLKASLSKNVYGTVVTR